MIERKNLRKKTRNKERKKKESFCKERNFGKRKKMERNKERKKEKEMNLYEGRE